MTMTFPLNPDYPSRMARRTARKIEQTKAKLAKLGVRDEDDYGLVLPPASFKADLPVRDATGQWSGPGSWAANFRWLMENHPCYIDPDDAIAGRWMFMLSRMRQGYLLHRSNFAFDYSHLEPLQKKYDITPGIGKDAHFAPDYRIGLDLGWGGLLEKVRAARLRVSQGRGRPAASGRDGESADGRIKTELSPNPVHPVNPVKPPKQPPLLPISQPPRSESNSTHEVIGLLPLLAVCLAGGIAAGATGVFATVTLFSLLLFMLVLCGATSSITVWLAAALSVAAVYAAGRRKGAGGPYLSGYDIAVSLFVGAIVLGATGLIARAHPFVAPYGLAITGGRAKLWFLSGGIPSGFFTDAAWRLLEPAYPPGCAALTFGCYGASGICGDWLTQLAPCLFAAAAAVFLASRTTGLARLWLALLFLTPVALMMTGQFYPEPLMALGVLVGWERVRDGRWGGWLLIGAAGWFKNEGLFFLIAAWLAWRIIEGSRRASVRDLVCAMTLPLAWHAGCRIAGATLNDYLAPWRLSPMRGLRGLGESLGLVFLRPWDYGFAYPAAIVAALVPSVRRQSRPLVAALLFTAFSVAFFCLAYACSTADEAWHVSTSLPRLLWTPALILAREFAEVDRA